MSKQDEKKPKVWFVRHEDLPMGPFPGAKIRHMLLEGELTLEDQISGDRKHGVSMIQEPEVFPLPLPPANVRIFETFGFLVDSEDRCWLYDIDNKKWVDIGAPPGE